MNECKKCEKHFLEMELFAQCHLLQRSIFSYYYLSFKRGWVSITSLVQMTQKVVEQWQSFHHPSSQQKLLPASNGHMHFGANITSFTELLSNKLGNMLPKQVSSCPMKIFQVTYFFLVTIITLQLHAVGFKNRMKMKNPHKCHLIECHVLIENRICKISEKIFLMIIIHQSLHQQEKYVQSQI